jgi:6-phosphogluconolactonase
VFASDADVGLYICAKVEELAKAAIADKGAFSMSIGSGTTVKPLATLSSSGIDFSRVHLFFGNERTEGETALKCARGADEFIDACSVPRTQVHVVQGGDSEAAARAYEKLLLGMPANVVGTCARGLPSIDLVLLGSGKDGHTASLYPGSPQVLSSEGRAVLPAAGKGGVTFTLGTISSARHVLLSAGKREQADMVRNALRPGGSALPAGMIAASSGTTVEWLLTAESAMALLA